MTNVSRQDLSTTSDTFFIKKNLITPSHFWCDNLYVNINPTIVSSIYFFLQKKYKNAAKNNIFVKKNLCMHAIFLIKFYLISRFSIHIILCLPHSALFSYFMAGWQENKHDLHSQAHNAKNIFKIKHI